MNIKLLGIRYILCTLFLSLGGCCVTLQTIAVTKHIPKTHYLKGKLLQALYSVTIALITQPFLFSERDTFTANCIVWICILLSVFVSIIIQKNKFYVAFMNTMMYNKKKKGG